MYILYGIPNCDTIKKARTWLEENGIAYTFYDYKKNSITLSKLKDWSQQVGWQTLLNQRGTTWRELDEATRLTITTEKKALSFLAENTSGIKRPLLEKEGKVIAVGFDKSQWALVNGQW